MTSVFVHLKAQFFTRKGLLEFGFPTPDNPRIFTTPVQSRDVPPPPRQWGERPQQKPRSATNRRRRVRETENSSNGATAAGAPLPPE